MNSNSASATSIGKQAEVVAKTYLLEEGLTFLTENFHNRRGEIDLIMQEQQTLVFVEVKYRKSPHYGGAISAISCAKQEKIKQCAAFYLQKSGLNEYNTPCRFDAVLIDGSINTPKISWLKNAF